MPRRDQDGLEYMFKDAATESLWDDEPEGGGGASPFPDSPLGRGCAECDEDHSR
jgi:hypothetical protein